MIKSIKSILSTDKEKYKVPKKVQDVIPIKRIWPDGIFLVGSKFVLYTAKNVDFLTNRKECGFPCCVSSEEKFTTRSASKTGTASTTTAATKKGRSTRSSPATKRRRRWRMKNICAPSAGI